MITFKLNGKTVQGEEGQYILQVAQKYGVEIPTLCHHKALEPAGMCRLCTVELFDGRRTRFVTSCNYPIWEGMDVKTDSEPVHEGRKLIVELLMARCPDVPILKELGKKYGILDTLFKKEEDTCILCGLCTRICTKMGNSAISLTGRGVDMKVDTPFHLQTDTCMACGACASVCPTGHITLEKIRQNVTTHPFKPIASEYDMGLKGRKPVYVPYAQAVPKNDSLLKLVKGDVVLKGDFGFGGGILENERIDQLTVFNGFFHNFRNMFRLDLGIENALRMDDHDGAFFTEPVTPGQFDLDLFLKILTGQFFHKGRVNFGSSIRAAS